MTTPASTPPGTEGLPGHPATAPDRRREDHRDHPVIVLPITAAEALQLWGTQCSVIGYSVRNVGAAAELFTLLDGVDGNGQPLVSDQIPAGGASVRWFAPHGVPAVIGLFAASGADVTGAVYVTRRLS